jgi:hypothetical protein
MVRLTSDILYVLVICTVSVEHLSLSGLYTGCVGRISSEKALSSQATSSDIISALSCYFPISFSVQGHFIKFLGTGTSLVFFVLNGQLMCTNSLFSFLHI